MPGRNVICTPASGRRVALGAVLAAAAAACIAFAPTLRNGLVLDDDDIILQNPLVTDACPWYRFWVRPYWPAGVGWDLLYRPVTILSLRMNYLIHGGAPMGYHLVNVLLHAAVSALVAVLAIRWWGKPAAGWAAGLLYAVHPIHVEAVAPVAGRSELLAALFGMTAVYLLMTAPEGIGRPQYCRAAAIGVLFFLAVASKEHAVFLYPVVIALDLRRRRTIPALAALPPRTYFNAAFFPHHLALLTALAAFLLLRWNVFEYRFLLDARYVSPYVNPLVFATLAEKLWTPFALFALAVRLVIWPVNLTTFYDVGNTSLAAGPLDPRALAGTVLFAAAALATGLAWRCNRRIWFPLAAFLLTMLMPCQFLTAIKWFFAERWLYLPTVFLAIGVGGAACRLPRATVGLAVVLAAVCLPNTLRYEAIWSDDLTMNLAATERRPGTFHGRYRAALHLMRQNRHPEAAAFLEPLARQFPGSVEASELALIYYLDLGDLENAEEAVRRLVAIDPLLTPEGGLRVRLEELRARRAETAASRPGTTSNTTTSRPAS